MLRSAFAVGFFTLLSRVTGLFRELTFAYYLGTGAGADAFRVAVLLPNIFRRLVGEGAITSAFVPVFTSYIHKEKPAAVRDFAEKFLTLWTVVLIVITLLGMAFSGWWGLRDLLHVGGAWPVEKIALTADLTCWLFPYLLVIGLSAVMGGILNSHGIFALPSATPLFYNLAFIAAGFLFSGLFPGEQAVYSFTIGVLAGGTLQLVVLIPSLWRLGIRPRLRWWGGHAGVREVLRLLIPGTFGAGVYQINVLVSNLIAMRLPDEGSVAALGYASRLMEVVLGIFVFALSTVSLTTLSRMAASGDRAGFRSTLSEVFRLTSFITIPSTIGLYILCDPVVVVLLKSGEFNDRSALLTTSALRAYIPGIVLVGINRVLVSAFYSMKNIWYPVKVGVVNLAINALLCWVLIEPRLGLGHTGIALASTIAALIQCLWLSVGFIRREGELLAGREILDSIGRSVIAALVMGLAAWLLVGVLPGQERGKVVLAPALFLTIATCAAVFFGAGLLLRAREPAALAAILRRRRRRAG
jgi:putative peptidoglycan lipid II flippase